ncbi:hypothetical protein L6452_36010 [Arctium lappa]|uniref:Uncharacterized protein n=1 Tax=Arctium lappa TaxID=4217 RepID=A0ACB8Y9F1_ARCLA|nr:hypothetical protein L6452_36010 [Arctium lappa]
MEWGSEWFVGDGFTRNGPCGYSTVILREEGLWGRKKERCFFSAVFCCFAPPRVSEEDQTKKVKKVASSSRSKSCGAPIPVSYFPVGSNISRL